MPASEKSMREWVSPRQAAAACAASPFKASREPKRPSEISMPCSASSRAATKPSPPLLPGPQTTKTRARTGIGCTRSRKASRAMAPPARSIKTMPGVPAAIVKRSADAISSFVRSSGWLVNAIIGKPYTKPFAKDCGVKIRRGFSCANPFAAPALWKDSMVKLADSLRPSCDRSIRTGGTGITVGPAG